MAALAVGAILAGGVALAWPDGGGRKLHSWRGGKGPLWGGSMTFVGIAVETGQPFTYGAAHVSNLTDETAVLEAVRVRPPLPDGLEIVGIGATGPNRKVITVNATPEYPDPDTKDALHALPGTEVPPAATKAGKAGIDLVFGLKVTKPGFFGFAQIDLDYRVGDKPYTVRLDHGVYACPPASAYPEGCQGQAFMETLQREAGIKVR